MRGTNNFLWRVIENDADAQNRDIRPTASFPDCPRDAATAVTFRTPASVFEWLDAQTKFLAMFGEPEPRDFHLFQV